jgi:hypothetical protein
MDRMLFKARVLLVGLVALLLMGSVGSGAAYAEAGPYFHVRAVGEKGAGEGVSETNPLEVQGEGGEQVLNGEVATTKVEIAAKSVQVKGVLYNVKLQGQVKLLLKYVEPRLVKPALKECEVKLGVNNEVKTEGHLAWKWNGETKQLEEKPQVSQKPDLIFTPAPLEVGAKELPKGSDTTVTFKGSGCGVLVGVSKIGESQSALPKLANLEEWSKEPAIASPGWKRQHFWNGKESIGAETGLTLGGNPATLAGSMQIKAPGTEVAIFETAPVIIEENGVLRMNFMMINLGVEMTQEFKYMNVGNAAWTPRVPSEGVVRVGQWSLPVVNDVNCLNGNIAANGGRCSVRMKAKPEVAGGGSLAVSYRSDDAAPFISIVATS